MPYPQTFKGIQDVVIAKLRMAASAANRSLVKDWINQAYMQAAEETQALQEAGFSTLTPGSGTYTLPTRISELKWVIGKGVSEPYYGTPLSRVSIDQMLTWRQGNAGTSPVTGSATAYALIGLNQLEVFPTPTTADTIQFYYSYLPTALANDGDIPDFQEPWGSKVLEYGALKQGAELQMHPLLQQWAGEYQDWKTRLRVHMNKRGGMTDQFPIVRSRPIPHDRSVDIGC